MTQQTAKPSFFNNSARCTYRFANGRRCRLSASNVDSAFCPSHARLPENQREPADTAVSLTADLKEFRSAIPINDFLARLTNSSALFPRSTASSIPRKIPTPQPRSSSTCPAPSAIACRRQSPPTPTCVHNHATETLLTFSLFFHRT